MFVVTNNSPTGTGHVGISIVARAIGNAVVKFIGEQRCHMPMSSDRVKKALT